MRYTLVTVAAAFAAVSLSEAVPGPQNGQVRYYFPREIKRQLIGVNLGALDNSTSSTSTDLIDQLANGLKQAQSTSGNSGDSGSADPSTTPAGGIIIGQNTVISSTGANADNSPSTAGSDELSPSSTPGDILTNLLPSATPTLTDALSGLPTTATDTGGLQITPTSDPGITGPSTAPSASNTDSIVTPTDTGLQITPTDTSLQITPTGTPLPTITDDPIITPPVISSSQQPTQEPITSPPDNPSTSGFVGPTTGGSPDPTTAPPNTTPGPSIDTGVSSPPTQTGTPSPSALDSSVTAPSSIVESPTSQVQGTPTSNGIVASTSQQAPQSISPTATNTDTALSQASSIVSASSTSGESSVATSSASTIPSSLPRIIVSPDATSQTAANNDSLQLVQLGFTYGLNYPFVVSNTWAIQQIFNFLPPGIAHGIDSSNSDVIVQYLQPLNTLSRTGYITTLAMAKIPIQDVNTLSVALLNPKADLWNNKNVTIRTLVNMIDPTIPLLAGSSLGDGSLVNNGNGAGSGGSGNSNGAAGTDDSNGNSSVKPSSIGIGLGVVGGAALYGVAMFMVAKRYKKRKNAHKRASSVQSGSSNGSGARETNTLMTGARNSYGSRPQMTQTYQGGRESRTSDRSGQSGRTYISPPVMAENSLGWN